MYAVSYSGFAGKAGFFVHTIMGFKSNFEENLGVGISRCYPAGRRNMFVYGYRTTGNRFMGY